jgi:PelA/Pel-15E family pectate lyase
MKIHFARRVAVTVTMGLLISAAAVFPAPKKTPAQNLRQQALAAMAKSSAFMMNTVSTRGGFVWNYSADLTERWGEVPARPSQIWVQGATNGVGEMFLDAFEATGDSLYLSYAKRVADSIVWGQYPAGGWHYLIDFDMPGIQNWYDEAASKCWGWEEYYHFYGNCTFDDDSTTSSVEFLMHLYLKTLDPAYRAPLLKGIEFILEAQYPNGGWPQRYPLSHEFPHDGVPDYTSYYTFNDGVIPNCIFLLVEAWEKLGDERCWKAAQRGMDFYLISQGPEEQAGWSSQYDMNLQPAQARSYEPAAWSTFGTAARIGELERFYGITGDRRYLRPIPAAIAWLERSVINTDPAKPYTHGRFLEPGTNRALVAHRMGSTQENGHYYVDYNLENPITHMGMIGKLDIPSLKKEYDRVKALTTEQARTEVAIPKKTAAALPEVEAVKKIVGSLDPRGAWVTDIKIAYYADPINGARRELKGISTREFVANMSALIAYVDSGR